MALSLDGTTTDSQATVSAGDSFSHTTPSGSDLALVVAISSADASPDKVTSVEYNGTAMTLEVEYDTSSGDGFSQVWSLANPSTGSNSVEYATVTGAISDVAAVAYSFSGVDQTTPIDATASNRTTTSPSVSVTTNSADSWLVASMVSEQSLPDRLSADSPATERLEIDFGADIGGISDRLVTTATNYTMSWTDTDNDENAVMVVGEVKAASGGTSYTLTADGGSFTITGTASNLEYNRHLDVDSGSYTITGTSATLYKSIVMTSDAGSFTITGTDAGFLYNRHLDVDSGSYTITGTAANLEYNRTMPADPGNYTITGTDASLEYGYTLSAGSGSFSVNGTAANLEVGYVLSSEAGSYVITGTDAALSYLADTVLTADPGSFTVTGTAVTFGYNYVVVAGAGSYSITGTNATLTYAQGETEPGEVNTPITIQQIIPVGVTLEELASSITLTKLPDTDIEVAETKDSIIVEEQTSSIS